VGIDECCVMVANHSEVSQRKDGGGGRGGRGRERRMLVWQDWHAAHNGFTFMLCLVSRRQGGCGPPRKEGP
jgi:hypothetical protein